MIQLDIDQTALAQQCQASAEALLSRYGWRLLGGSALASRAAQIIQEGRASEPQRAAIATYASALHGACSGAEGHERQNQGYTELAGYLYQLAQWRFPDVADDATQRALERTFASFERCRQPLAFLAFAIQQLADAARAIRRQERPSLPLEEAEAALPAQPDPAAQVLDGEIRAALEQFREAFLHSNPRAAQQFAALWLKYIEDLDDDQIARKLGVSVENVYVLRSRAIRRLRADPRWHALASELGIGALDAAPRSDIP